MFPVAADDERLKRAIRWLLTDEHSPDVSEEEDYDYLQKLVAEEYGLNECEIEAVISLCEDNTIKELNT